MNEHVQALRQIEQEIPPSAPYDAPGEVVVAARDDGDETVDGETVLRLYGPIGPWDQQIRAEDVAQALERAPADRPLRVRIQSPGGSAAEGLALYQQLRAWPGRVITQVDGMAVSAAALVFLAGDERQVPKSGALLMFHEAWLATLAVGNKGRMRAALEETIKLLTALDADIVALIAERSGMAEPEAAAVIEAVTWYRPAEALQAGLATGYRPDAVAPGIRPGAIRPGAIRPGAIRPSVRAALQALGAPDALMDELPEEDSPTTRAAGQRLLACLKAADIKRRLSCT